MPKKLKRAFKSVPPEWEQLFLVVSDIMDGISYARMEADLTESYFAVFNTPLGQKLYKEALANLPKEKKDKLKGIDSIKQDKKKDRARSVSGYISAEYVNDLEWID